jgi:hypothetical protein
MPETNQQAANRPVGSLVRSLGGVRQAIRRFRLGWACVSAVAAFACILAIAESFERLFVLRESQALLLVAGAGALAVLLLVRSVLGALLRAPAVHDLALRVEAVHPELLDSFVCAVELEASGRQDLGPLEEALIAQVERKTQALDFQRVFRASLPWRRLALFGLVVATALGVLGQARVARKARFHLADLLSGAPSGLVIDYPQAPVPEHTDVRLEVTVKRWEPDAEIIYEDADGRHRFALNRTPQGGSYFTLYDVTGEVRFLVQTPSLRSQWQRVETYVPPQFDDVELRVRQPAYTGRKDLVFPEFRSCTAVEGSEVQLAIRTAPSVEASVVMGDTVVPMAPDPTVAGQFRHSWQLQGKLSFHVQLRTDRGFTALGPETVIQSEPDLPPVVEVTEPRKDTQALINETVYLGARASDDFGIGRIALKYTVSGGEDHIPVLFQAKPGVAPQAEMEAGHKLDLAKLGVKEGDVIAYAFIAYDNREPNPQMARSHVFFITVRPDLEEAKQQEGKGQGEQKELDLSSLIAELKRLIRLNWDQLDTTGSEADALRDELYRGLKDLSVETGKKMNEVLQAAGPEAAGQVTQLFQSVEREILRAAGLVERNLVEEAMAPEQRALATLVALENQLLKNAMKSQGQGQGKKSQNQGEKTDQPPQQNGDQAGQQAQAMAKVREALDQVRRLAERQDALNQDLQRTPDNVDKPLADALADKQTELNVASLEVRKDLGDLPDAAQAVRDLQTAEGEMRKTAQALGKQNLPVARPHGARAHNMLLSAIRSLEEAQRKQAAERINQLAQAAQQLSDAQSQAADESRQMGSSEKAGAEQAKGAREKQDAIKDMNDRLNEAIERTAGEFEETFPQASKALAEAARGAREAGTSRKMTRAANALLYRRFDRARREQTDAANELLKLSGELSEAGRNLPTMTREELLEAMRQIQKEAQDVQRTMQQGEGQETRRQLGKQAQKGAQGLDRMASAMQDDKLQQIADEMSLPQGGESALAEGQRILGMYQAAMRVLERHLVEAGIERKLGLSRETANPPEKYRRLVEQYFKDLSREK